MGNLRVAYDDDVFGYHVYMTSDNGQVLCEHIIAIQTALRTEKKKASWSAIDLTLDPPKRRRFRATFSSVDALKEFTSIFEEVSIFTSEKNRFIVTLLSLRIECEF